MSRVSEKALRDLAASFGADLVIDGGRAPDLDAWTPAGVVWRSTGCHSLVYAGYPGQPIGDARREMFDEMSDGVEPCSNPECDTCHPERE